MITPYLNNSINFCNKDSAKEEMRGKLGNAVFNPIFNRFLQSMTDGNFINIKLALSYIGDKLADFNKLPSFTKQALILKWSNELEKAKNSH